MPVLEGFLAILGRVAGAVGRVGIFPSTNEAAGRTAPKPGASETLGYHYRFRSQKWRAHLLRERLRHGTPRLPQESPDRSRLRCRARKRTRTRAQLVGAAAQLGLSEARRQPAGVLVQDSRRVQQDGATPRRCPRVRRDYGIGGESSSRVWLFVPGRP